MFIFLSEEIFSFWKSAPICTYTYPLSVFLQLSQNVRNFDAAILNFYLIPKRFISNAIGLAAASGLWSSIIIVRICNLMWIFGVQNYFKMRSFGCLIILAVLVSRTTNIWESFHSKFDSDFYTPKPTQYISIYAEALKSVQTEMYKRLRR